MEKRSFTERSAILKEELAILVEHKYITKNEYDHILGQHAKHYHAIELSRKRIEETRRAIAIQEVTPNVDDVNQAAHATPVPQPIPIIGKPKRTKDEQRERNITWVLILGVLMLLISGLLLATSAWDTMNNLTKTFLITFVSVLFYGLAYLSKNILKIEKTAFAFNVLGSLFLPIVIISIGYFELFGTYFSLFGEGKYLFGIAGSLAILPIYVYFTYRLMSRMYVWFSYITLSLLAALILAAFNLPVDGFYLGVMLFNALLILCYYWQRKNQALMLFLKEFTLYIQTNLILSSLLLLVFYNNEVIHGFNLMITALLYFSIIYITNHKDYHYVFTAMLVYGTYQMIEFSVFKEFGAIGYAFLGLILLGIPKLMKEENSLKRIFQYTSAIISGLAFVFISLQAILFRMDYPSIVMLLAYLVIALNFIFLTNITKKPLFSYLAPIFILVSFKEAITLSEQNMILSMFFASAFVYILIGCLQHFTLLKSIKNSSRDVASAGLIIFFLVKLPSLDFLYLGIMLVTLSLISLLMYYYENRKAVTTLNIPSWIHPITLGFSIQMFFLLFMEHTSYHSYYVTPIGLVLAGLIILAISYLWKKYHFNQFSQHGFIVSHIFYLLGFILSFTSYFSDSARCFIVFGGIMMAYLFYLRTNRKEFSYVIGSFSLLFYLTSLDYVHQIVSLDNEIFLSLELVFAVGILLFIGFVIQPYNAVLAKGFYYVAYLYLPFALLLSVLNHFDNAFWPFAWITIIYVLSSIKVMHKRISYLFLYAAYTSGFFMFIFYNILIELNNYYHYTFVVMSVIIAINWYFAKSERRLAIGLYLIPFSLLGHVVLVSMNEINILLFVTIFLYASGIIYVSYKQKLQILYFMPLFFNLLAINTFSQGDNQVLYISLLLYAIVLVTVGLWHCKSLYNYDKKAGWSVDWFTIISLLALFVATMLEKSLVIEKVMPGLLITLVIVLQRNRVKHVKPKWVLFIAGIYFLQPYYTLLNNITIPDLFVRELQVLPWIILVIILRKVASVKQFTKASYIQWAVVVTVALLLIQDGLASNTIYDALILGSLSLLAIIAGFIYKTKSFFFVGSGVLLLNVFLQTRPFWGNMPWWVYLLLAGSILITVASLNEWQKQKKAEGKETFIKLLYKNIFRKFKEWQ